MEPEESDQSEREPLLRLAYSSCATRAFDTSELVELLSGARENNDRLSVSGMLLYAAPTFLQVLEGDPEVVENLYDTIEADERHDSTRILLREEVDERDFADWSMGFVQADREMLQSIPGLSDFMQQRARGTAREADDNVERVRKILEQFRSGRWRRELSN